MYPRTYSATLFKTDFLELIPNQCFFMTHEVIYRPIDIKFLQKIKTFEFELFLRIATVTGWMLKSHYLKDPIPSLVTQNVTLAGRMLTQEVVGRTNPSTKYLVKQYPVLSTDSM